MPSWINLSKTRLNVKTPNGRISVTKAKTTVFRYFFGWELFWFTLDSPYYGLGFTELAAAAGTWAEAAEVGREEAERAMA